MHIRLWPALCVGILLLRLLSPALTAALQALLLGDGRLQAAFAGLGGAVSFSEAVSVFGHGLAP